MTTLRTRLTWASIAGALVLLIGLSPTVQAQSQSNDATLSALTLSGIDFGTFASGTTSYTAQVFSGTTQTHVTATRNHPRATYLVKLGGVTDEDGTIDLSAGSNVITVEVTAEDGQTMRTYSVTVTRPVSNNAHLINLTLSGISIEHGSTFYPPGFSALVFNYTPSVAHSLTETTVTPTAHQSFATYVIKLDGVTDADGVIALSVGSNVITIEVTAEDGESTKTYTITVTRASAPLTDATLKRLALSDIDIGGGVGEGADAQIQTAFKASVYHSVSQTTVSPTVNYSGASYVIKLGGVEDADGTISLAVGSNVITVEVTAEDDSTTKTYTATVNRATASAPTTGELSTDDPPVNFRATDVFSDHTIIVLGFPRNRGITGWVLQRYEHDGDEFVSSGSTMRSEFTGSKDLGGEGLRVGNSVVEPGALYKWVAQLTNSQGSTVIATSLTVRIPSTDDENLKPTISTRRPPTTYAENRSTTVYTFRASDPQSQTITWTLEGTDRGDFTLARDSSGRGVLTFNSPPDFEDPADSDRQNDYELTVIATDEDGHADLLSFTVTVTDVNERPEISRIGNAPGSVPENYDLTLVLARYSATDPELGTVSRWSTSGTDGGDFVIDEQGELRFRNTPDYERPADSNRDNVYVFTVRAYDGRVYGIFEETVTVTPVDELPTITTTVRSATELSQAENRTSRLYTYRATDPERSTISWSVVGTDGRFFTIDERGQFSFSETNPPDYEIPGDSGGDNVYNVTVQATDDGFNSGTLDVVVTVTDVNEGPDISGQSTFTIAENRDLPNAVYTATDPEGANVALWSVGGRDGGDFFITQGGTLYFRTPPDYERPADSNRDNVYEVTVQASDGRNTGSYPVTVAVTGVNEAPEFRRGSNTSFTQAENRTSRLYTFSATDPEGSTVTWSVGGPDGSHFTIDERGQFSFDEESPPNFDAPGDQGGDNVYNVTIQALDAQFITADLPVTVTVTQINERPVITRQGSAPGSVPENHPATQVLARYTASDPERPSVQVTRWSTAGPDGGDFVINALGELRFRSSPDYERPADANRDNVYEVTIRASDGRNTNTLEEVQTVTVTDVNERPTITTKSRTAFNQRENLTPTLYTFRATDPEKAIVTWTAGGTDGSHFTIDEQGRFFLRQCPGL